MHTTQNTRVNSYLLHTRIADMPIKQYSAIRKVNRNRPHHASKQMAWILAAAFALSGALAWLDGWHLSLVPCAATLIALGPLIVSTFLTERRAKAEFESIAQGIELAERDFAAAFDGYEDLWKTNLRFRSDREAFRYALDWARADVLRFVDGIGKNGLDTGALKAKFDSAKALFGDAFDLGRGYEPFFNGQIVHKMSSHTSGL